MREGLSGAWGRSLRSPCLAPAMTLSRRFDEEQERAEHPINSICSESATIHSVYRSRSSSGSLSSTSSAESGRYRISPPSAGGAERVRESGTFTQKCAG